MHPVTPVLKAWKVIVALFFLGVIELGPQLAGQDGLDGLPVVASLIVVLVVGALLAAGYSAVAWRVTRYALDEDRVYLQTGLLFRRHREARLDRLQAVDVVQPLVARLVGLSQLTVEQAGGAGSQVQLAYLTEARAHELRNEILARAAGVQRGTPSPPGPIPPPPPGPPPPGPVMAPAEEAPEREVLSVPVPRVLASIVLSSATLSLLLAGAGLVVVVMVTDSVGALGALLPMALGAVTYAWNRFSGEFAFRAAISPDGIRLRHGLTESRAQTVPPGRVQAMRLTQPLLWRPADWWRVQVNVAGYAGTEVGKESVLLPVGTREEALLAIWLVLPDLGDPNAAALLEAGLTGRDDDGGFVASPRRARWLDPVAWRRNGLRTTPRAILLRGGRITRHLDLVPHERTQSLGLVQGPLQRRLGLSSFVVHSTPGPVAPAVAHLDARRAAEILLGQAERARTARASAGPERWMQGRV